MQHLPILIKKKLKSYTPNIEQVKKKKNFQWPRRGQLKQKRFLSVVALLHQ